MISGLQTHRTIASIGVESWEMKILHPEYTQKDISAHYLSIAIEQTLAGYVSGAASGIKSVYTQKKTVENGVAIESASLHIFHDSYRKLDTQYGVNISKVVEDFKKSRDYTNVAQEAMYGKIRTTLFEHFARVDPEFANATMQLRTTLQSHPNFQIQHMKNVPLVSTQGGKVPINFLLEQYRLPLVKFQNTHLEREKFQFRAEDQ